jgi:hypothetical protein
MAQRWLELAKLYDEAALRGQAVQTAVTGELRAHYELAEPGYSSAQFWTIPAMRRRNLAFSIRMNAFAKANPSEMARNSFT